MSLINKGRELEGWIKLYRSQSEECSRRSCGIHSTVALNQGTVSHSGTRPGDVVGLDRGEMEQLE